jgi:hypothetical protein
MLYPYIRLCLLSMILLVAFHSPAQSFKTKYNNSSIYTGIEVGSKGVKLSVVEIGKNARNNGAFNILKDTSVNTDFISFTPSTFQATLDALSGLYSVVTKDYKISPKRIYTVLSSGVKMQAARDNKNDWILELIDSFKTRIKEPQREVEVVDVQKEAMLSHLGIVPESRRYTTFLVDIGSGNTKGGFFPGNNLQNFKLFQLNWGTKTVANAAEKRTEDDKSLANYYKQLYRVLIGAENDEIIYAVNSSGAYPLSDNIAISGGIAWAIATLLHPEQFENTVVPVTYAEVAKFTEAIYKDYASFSEKSLSKMAGTENDAVAKEVKRIHQVFDQRALMAGSGLLLKMMRQFESAFESKQFFLVKNGQVGWISAYVEQSIDR